MALWKQMNVKLRWISINCAERIGVRHSGLFKLRNDVKKCEYEDVHVMWDMLKRSETEPVKQTGSPSKRKRPFWKIIACAGNVRYLCCRC